MAESSEILCKYRQSNPSVSYCVPNNLPMGVYRIDDWLTPNTMVDMYSPKGQHYGTNTGAKTFLAVAGAFKARFNKDL